MNVQTATQFGVQSLVFVVGGEQHDAGIPSAGLPTLDVLSDRYAGSLLKNSTFLLSLLIYTINS